MIDKGSELRQQLEFGPGVQSRSVNSSAPQSVGKRGAFNPFLVHWPVELRGRYVDSESDQMTPASIDYEREMIRHEQTIH